MRILWLCMIASMLVACSGEAPLADLEPREACWKISNRLEANFSHAGGPLEMPVELALTGNYPFSNLYLKVTLSTEAGVDTSWIMSETFVDPLGNWLVPLKGGSYTISHNILRKQDMPAGNYSLTLGHNMRPERVCGVKAIRLYKQSVK